jgi:polar amino acid transport system permease protein
MTVGGGGEIGKQYAFDAMAMPKSAAIVGQIAEARRRATFRFRAIFVATWVIFIGGLAFLIAQSGRVDMVALLQTWGTFIIGGVPVTIFVSVTSIFFAVIFAVFGALGRLSKSAPIYAIATLYVSVVRGTPLIVQIIFVYLALPQFGLVFDALACGIFALAFNYGAYLTEIFRAGIEAIPRGQREAAGALGMTESQTMRRVILPQAVRIVIPAIGNDFISMIKDSALVSYITIEELFWRANNVGNQTFRSFEALLLAAVVYWVLTIVFSFFQERLEKRLAESDVRL